MRIAHEISDEFRKINSDTLRQDLVDDGYTKFSIQMPVLAADAT